MGCCTKASSRRQPTHLQIDRVSPFLLQACILQQPTYLPLAPSSPTALPHLSPDLPERSTIKWNKIAFLFFRLFFNVDAEKKFTIKWCGVKANGERTTLLWNLLENFWKNPIHTEGCLGQKNEEQGKKTVIHEYFSMFHNRFFLSVTGHPGVFSQVITAPDAFPTLWAQCTRTEIARSGRHQSSQNIFYALSHLIFFFF